jgi:hypothetical protein
MCDPKIEVCPSFTWVNPINVVYLLSKDEFKGESHCRILKPIEELDFSTFIHVIKGEVAVAVKNKA